MMATRVVIVFEVSEGIALFPEIIIAPDKSRASLADARNSTGESAQPCARRITLGGVHGLFQGTQPHNGEK
ncbi:MAG: hypothetical protein R3D43_02030 [Tepidamorphaceae bacterium]